MITKIKHFFQKQIRGWSDDETYDLSISFMKWVNSRFRAYKKNASTIIDLEFHKIKYKSTEYTLGELIDKVIYLTNMYIVLLDKISEDEKLNSIKNEVFDIFKEIYWYMWW